MTKPPARRDGVEARARQILAREGKAGLPDGAIICLGTAILILKGAIRAERRRAVRLMREEIAQFKATASPAGKQVADYLGSMIGAAILAAGPRG